MIKEDYVSFEIAKLLKEKGFDEDIHCFYSDYDKIIHPIIEIALIPDCDIYPCPTQQMAMKWLREVHNIIITIDYNDDSDCEDNERYGFSVYYLSRKVDLATYVTYEQACEAAILYCLTKLI